MTALIIFFVWLAVAGINAAPFNDVELDLRSPDEFGDLFQGDIELTPEQEAMIKDTSRGSRTGLLDTKYRWPKNENGLVVVPYQFNFFSGFSQSDKITVREGLRELETHTCVRFISRTSESDYVQIINGAGCYSPLGRTGGRQQLSLKRNGCVYKGTVMHEFIHALGYHHMHNHIDRDDYVTVHIENVDPSMRHNFEKVNPAVFGNFGTTYDYLSVMHYPRWAFSNNGKDTMVPTDPSYIDKIGASELTEGDIARINNMYECKV